MIRGLARLLFLRLLPRRLLPVLTALEVYRLVRDLRRGRASALPPAGQAPGSSSRGAAARRPPPP